MPATWSGPGRWHRKYKLIWFAGLQVLKAVCPAWPNVLLSRSSGQPARPPSASDRWRLAWRTPATGSLPAFRVGGFAGPLPVRRESFFKISNRPLRLGMMPGPRRQLPAARRAQLPAQCCGLTVTSNVPCSHATRPAIRRFGPPAHHTVQSRLGTSFNDLGQRLALHCVQQRQLSRSLAADQPLRALRVEPQHPFGGKTIPRMVFLPALPHRLQPHAARKRGVPPRATRVIHRQSQKPAHLSRIPAPPRQSPQIRRRKIPRKPNRRTHRKPPKVCGSES